MSLHQLLGPRVRSPLTQGDNGVPMDINILSYNCRGLRLGHSAADKARRIIVDQLLEQCHVLCLQETFLTKQDLNGLNSISDRFHGAGESTTDLSLGIKKGRIPGGVAILWNKSLDSAINVIRLSVDWCIAIQVTQGDKKFIILNIYLPYECQHHEEEYVNKLAFISSYLQSEAFTNVFIVGDMNADISDKRSSFAKHISQFCEDNNLILSSRELLSTESYTHISEAWHTTSWLDHCLSTADAHASLMNMEILYNVSTSDHIPVKMVVRLECIPATAKSANTRSSGSCKLDWASLSCDDLDSYCNYSDQLLSNVYIPIEALSCKDYNCTNNNHKSCISAMYTDIISCLLEASKPHLKAAKRGQVRPGWNTYVAEFYAEAREATKSWAMAGKPRQGPIFEYKKSTNAKYKYAVRFINRNEECMRADSMARKLVSNSNNDFWKEVKHINGHKPSLPCSVDGVSGAGNIAELWRMHYSKLFNLSQPNARQIGNVESVEIINSYEVSQAIQNLSANKTTGMDHISAEHLKYASFRLYILLALCFTALMSHGFLPESMMTVQLVPVIKDKAGKVGSSNNYRPIALANILSKVVEQIILQRINNLISSTDHQFGFKAKHGTDMCIYMLKELLNNYKRKNSSIFICFLDASKAFDRLNHDKLFNKLRTAGVPKYIVRILSYWYAQQTMQVKWDNCLSAPFHISNGVRQGSILSPILFNFYMNDLSHKLRSCKTGCMVGSTVINHLMYADDCVIFSPSSAGLQQLLNECSMYGELQDIKFNELKSVIMICRTLEDKHMTFPEFRLSGKVLNTCREVKYLGHVITDQLTDDEDIYRQCRMLYVQANILARKFGNCSVNVKLTLFKTFCSPLYTAHLWLNYKKASFQRLQVAYNDALRILLRRPRWTSASELCVSHGVNTLSALLRNIMYRFICRLNDSKNHNVVAMINISYSDTRCTSQFWKHWYKCLL